MQAGLGLTRNRHGNQFHTRICIPKDLAPQLGRKEIRISLGTEQRRYAIQAARLIHGGKIPAFDELRAAMDKNNPNPTPEQQAEARNRLLTLIKQRQQAQPIPDHDEAAEAARYAQEADQQREREQVAALIAKDPDAALALALLQQEATRGLEHAWATQQATSTQLQAAKAAETAAIQEAATSINEAKAAHQQRQQAQDEHAATVERMAGQMANISIELARSSTTAAPGKTTGQDKTIDLMTDAFKRALSEKKELPRVPFSELVSEYQKDQEKKKKNGDGLTAQSMRQYSKAAEAFIGTMGDLFICDISRETMREFLDIEKEMPPMKNGNKKFKYLTRREAAALNKKEGGKTVVTLTATEHVLKVQAFFTWAIKNSSDPKKWGFTDYGNPCRDASKNIFTKTESREKKAKTRRKFIDEDLMKLFTGNFKERNRNFGYGAKRFKRRYHYWLPLLGLFTGARANELAQLRLPDIVEKDGVMCIDINEDKDKDGIKRKSVKTDEFSPRILPIHSGLIALGFLDYVKELRRSGHYFLFQELNPQNVTADEKTHDTKMEKWFGRYLDLCKVLDNKDGKIVFHSFRHTVTSRILSSSVPEYVANKVMGHAQSSMTTKRYMDLDISVLKSAVEAMQVPDGVFSIIPKWEDVKHRFTNAMPAPAKL